ncbi:MAG: hypothetical protein AAGG38_01630 [Planctomycetota bacterium]
MDSQGRRRFGLGGRWAYGLGVLLLGLAVVTAMRGLEAEVLRGVSVWGFAALMGLVGINLGSTVLLFWSVTRSFAADPPVGVGKMGLLIAMSGLLNYVPVVRAGLWGRAAYLKARHGLPVRQSVEILGVVVVLTGVVLGGAGAWLAWGPTALRWGGLLGGLVGLSVATPWLARWLYWRQVVQGWTWVPLRALDLGLTAGRLWLALWLLGVAAGPGEVVLLASGSVLVRLTGLTPNGLGLSEWTVAALGAALTGVDGPTAAAAAILDRAAEALVSVIAGSAAVWVLSREGRAVAGG